MPSPAGGILILMPLIYELSGLNFQINIKNFTPYFTILIALLLVSKIPTLSFKKISISSKTTVFFIISGCNNFTALLFYTFETIFIFGLSIIIVNSSKCLNL